MGAAAAKLYEPQMIDFKDILFGPSSMKLLSLDGLTVLFVEDVHVLPKEEICGDYSNKDKWIDSVFDKLFKKVNFPVNFFLETKEFYKSYLQKFKQEDLFKDDRGLTKSVDLFHNCVNITEKECGYLDTPVFFNNMETRRFESPIKYNFHANKLSLNTTYFNKVENTLFDLPQIYLNKVVEDILFKTRYSIKTETAEIQQEIRETRLRIKENQKYPDMQHDSELEVILNIFQNHEDLFEYKIMGDKEKNYLKKILEMLNLLNDPNTLKSLFSNLLYNQKSDDRFNKFKSMFFMFDETKEIASYENNPHFKFSKQLKTGIYDENIKLNILKHINKLCNKQEFKKKITDAIKICEALITIIFEKTNNFQKLSYTNDLMKGIRKIFVNINGWIFDMYNIARFMRMYPFDESEFEFAIVYAGRFHTTNMIGFLTKYYDGRIIASINTDSDENACIKFDTEQKIKFVRTLDEILLKLQSKDIITSNFFLEKIPRREDINLETIKKEIRELKKSRKIGSKESLEEIIKFHKYLSYHYRMKKRLEKYSGKQIVAERPLPQPVVLPLPQQSTSTETRPLPQQSTSTETRPLPQPSPQQSTSTETRPLPQPPSEDQNNLPGTVSQSSSTKRSQPSSTKRSQPSSTKRSQPSSTKRSQPSSTKRPLQQAPSTKRPLQQAPLEDLNKPSNLRSVFKQGGYKYNTSLYFNNCF